MSIKPCKKCGEKIKKGEKTCPHCGVKYPHVTNKVTAISCLVIVALIFGIIIILTGNSTTQNAGVSGEFVKKANEIVLSEAIQSIKSLGYVEKKNDGVSIFTVDQDGTNYRCDLYYQDTLKGIVSLYTVAPEPVNKKMMWQTVEVLTLDQSIFKDTLLLFFGLTGKEISMDDVLNAIAKKKLLEGKPSSSGMYHLVIDQGSHSLHARALWHDGRISLDYYFNE